MNSSTIKRFLWLLFYVLNFLIIPAFWAGGGGRSLFLSTGDFLISAGELLGLLGAYSLMWQVLLMSRLAPLEEVFGRLRLVQFHRLNGYIAFTFLICHPILLTIGYKYGTSKGYLAQFLRFLTSYEHVLNAFIALTLIVILVGATAGIVRRRLKYENWYAIHLCAYLAILLAFSHQTEVGGDFIQRPLFTTYWRLLYLALAVAVGYFRLARPLFRSWYFGFRVSEVVSETDDTVSIYVEGRHMEAFRFNPGQFARWRFLAPGLWWQAHPFSFSQSYDGKRLRLTVRALGDFTKLLPAVAVGTRVILEGPHGVFTPALRRRDRVLLIAGGIGITPLCAMIETFIASRCDVILLYACRASQDIAFRGELEKTDRAASNFHAHFLVEQSGDGGTFPGRITSEVLAELVPDLSRREIFICGPIAMMDGVTASLRSLGVAQTDIHSERFAY